MYYVYIVSSKKNGTLYIGITRDLSRRIEEHKKGIGSEFARKYNINNLVYFELFEDVYEAIKREKCLKKWKRAWKIRLIEEENPEWNDLSLDIH